MPRALVRLVMLLLVFTTVSLHAEDHGTELELQAVPSFLKRVFVPVLPGATNTFTITAEPVTEIVAIPQGFEMKLDNGRVRIESISGQAAGYGIVKVGGRDLTLTIVNLVPYEAMQNGRIDGYQVGEYKQPHKGLETYRRPQGFLRLTAANSELWVSDHYRLRDFQCKLDGDTKFLILRPEALIKLELMQHELARAHNLEFSRFTIMSGYRTPYYNAKIGNETSSSRHLYGDAMDIYVDENADGKMDDVNRDGKVNSSDAKFLLGIAETIDQSKEWNWLKGGAGVYHANAAHGPYVHVDARGYVARWGV